MLSTSAIERILISPLGLMLLIGTCGMAICAYLRRERFRLSLLQCIGFSLLLTAAGVAGAMVLYFLECGSFGGVSFYGSVILIPLLMPFAGLLFRLKPSQTMDLCGPCVALMIGCLRINCFISGCCGGWEACIGDFCFHWPTQIIDSIADFMIMVWLLQTEEKQPHSGKLYPMFMISYSVMRFFLEFLRDTPKDWLYLSHGQWFALVAIIIGVIWILILGKKCAPNGFAA